MVFLKNSIRGFCRGLVATVRQPVVIHPLNQFEDIPILSLHLKYCIDATKYAKSGKIGIFELFLILRYHTGDIMTLIQRGDDRIVMIHTNLHIRLYLIGVDPGQHLLPYGHYPLAVASVTNIIGLAGSQLNDLW